MPAIGTPLLNQAGQPTLLFYNGPDCPCCAGSGSGSGSGDSNCGSSDGSNESSTAESSGPPCPCDPDTMPATLTLCFHVQIINPYTHEVCCEDDCCITLYATEDSPPNHGQDGGCMWSSFNLANGPFDVFGYPLSTSICGIHFHAAIGFGGDVDGPCGWEFLIYPEIAGSEWFGYKPWDGGDPTGAYDLVPDQSANWPDCITEEEGGDAPFYLTDVTVS